MKISRLAVLFACVFSACLAFGGGGGGGGAFGKTTLLLQSLAYEQAVLSFDGGTAIPESETAPKLVIPADEYTDFVKEVEKEVSTGSEPFVLVVTSANGTVRSYELKHVGEVGREPLFLYLVEKTN